MRLKLFCLTVACFVLQSAFCQYLPPRFQGKTVYMKMTHSGKYVTGVSSELYQYSEQPDFIYQSFELQSSASANWYYIYDITAQQYVTLNQGLTDVYTAPKLANGTDIIYQTFQFVAQTQTDRFKIHTRFNNGSGFDYVLQITAGVFGDGADLKIGTNLNSNDDHQKFDLTDLNPPVNPGSATPSLADRFQGRTVGFTNLYFSKPVKGNGTSGDINSIDLASFPDFNKEFKIEYSGETGWYKIKHKSSGKYITLMTPIVDGGLVKLQTDAAYADDQQKFKFIIQGNDYTYKIHSKYSVGASGFEKALLLEMNPSNASAPMRLKKNITVGTDTWQKWQLDKYVAPAAQFTSGAATNGSGKILGKQYYFSSFESLALLEPDISGTDTFLRIQSSPVYGAQTEWTIDKGRKQGGVQYFRIRYGKTGQYLYLPTSNETNVPNDGFLFKLKYPNGTFEDKRYEFDFRQTGNAQHSFLMVSHAADSSRRAIIDDDGNLSAFQHDNSVSSYTKNEEFIINLSYPSDSNKLYVMLTFNQGHFLGDSGVVKSITPVVHREFIDYSCVWRFIPLGSDVYYIKNALTNQYLNANNSNAYGAQLYSQTSNAGNYAKWKINRDGNYYTFQNVGSSMYLSLLNHPEPEAYCYQGTIGSAGYYWAVSNMDYYLGGLAGPLNSIGLLSNYAPLAQNASNTSSYFQKMVQTVGFVYNPSYYKLTGIPGLVNSDLQASGFNPSNPPDFYLPFRSALKYTYKWNDAQADSAMKNYKTNIVGHRVEVAYAIRSFVLDSLSKIPRASWTYNERELVAYLERTVQNMKKSWGRRIEDSWNSYLYTKFNEELAFTVLYTGVTVPTDDYVYPPYITPTEAESVSQLEYAGYCSYKQYTNPSRLLNTKLPGFAVPAALALVSGLGYSQYGSIVAAQAAAARAAAQAATEVGTNIAERLATTEAQALFGAVGASGAACIVTVVLLAGEMLAATIMADVKFENFKTRLFTKASYLDTMTIDVNRVMQVNNLQNQFSLCQDFDIILGSGMRFNDTLHNDPIFVGTGNWSDGSNWSTNHPPVSPIANPVQEVIINPLEGGQCILDVPVLVQQGSKITVNPGKTFKVNSQLTVPGMNVTGQ